jgi:hypothetical protein
LEEKKKKKKKSSEYHETIGFEVFVIFDGDARVVGVLLQNVQHEITLQIGLRYKYEGGNKNRQETKEEWSESERTSICA